MDYAAKGDEALANSNAPLAFEYFTRALIQHPRSPHYYIQRATACGRLKPEQGGPNSSLALHDSEIALLLAVERGKRELILAAQFRRAISLFQLERYGDASYLFKLLEEKTATTKNIQDDSKETKLQAAMKGGKGTSYETQLPIWMMKVDRKMKELSEGDVKANVSIAEYPKDIAIPSEAQLKSELAGKLGNPAPAAEQSLQQNAPAASGAASDVPKPAASSAAPSATTVPEKVRHEWYQSQTAIVVTLYVKNIPKDKVETELKDDSVSIQFPLPSGSAYDFTLDPLYAPIDPSASKVAVMGTKIEITLQKKTPGQKWGSLEGTGQSMKLTERPTASTASAGPSYPTSSRHGTKDWDKVASTLTEKKSKKKDGKDDGNDSDDSDVGGDAVDGFFKKLYKGADDDTRRAMMKSYIESNGTSLSTNWSEVGSKTMEPHPPS